MVKNLSFWSRHVPFLCCHLQVFIVLPHGLNIYISCPFCGSVCCSFCLPSEMVHLPASWAFLAICQASSWLMYLSTVFTVYVSLSLAWFGSVRCNVLLNMPFHSVNACHVLCILWALFVLFVPWLSWIWLIPTCSLLISLFFYPWLALL